MIHFEEITLIDAPIDRVFDLSRSIEVHLLANVHENEQALAVGGLTTGLVGLGEQVTWRAKHFGLWHNLTSKATVVEPPTYLQVTMVKGVFSFHAGRPSVPQPAFGRNRVERHIRDRGTAPNPRTHRRGPLSTPLHDRPEPRTQCRH